jgi:hypothetical protein
MVYAINNFRHYLLDNKFVFYVDHLVLLYLINKLQVSGRLTRWLLLFLEFNFTVVYKPEKMHGVADALSRNEDAEPAVSILDQRVDAQRFTTDSDWLHRKVDYVTCRTFPANMTEEARKRLAHKAIPY